MNYTFKATAKMQGIEPSEIEFKLHCVGLNKAETLGVISYFKEKLNEPGCASEVYTSDIYQLLNEDDVYHSKTIDIILQLLCNGYIECVDDTTSVKPESNCENIMPTDYVVNPEGLIKPDNKE